MFEGQHQQRVNVDISQAKDVVCEKCENPYFMEVTRIKKLSILVSPTGREEKISIPVLLCANCGTEINF